MEYEKVWSVLNTNNIHQDNFVPIYVGILFIIYELIIHFRFKKFGEKDWLFTILNKFSRPKYPYSKIFIPIGFLAIIFGSILTASDFIDKQSLINIVNSKKYESVDGVVQVLDKPAYNRTGNDFIKISNEIFEISYYFSGNFYNLSINHNGYLKNSVFAKINYIPTTESEKNTYGAGKILEVFIKN